MTRLTTTHNLFILVYRTGVHSEMPATWTDLNRGVDTALFISEAEAEQARLEAIAELSKCGNGNTELCENLRRARIVNLSQFIVEHGALKQDSATFAKELGDLRQTIETFLEEGYEGALDGDDFIEEHRALSEAIGFEYEEEITFTVNLEVSAKVKRGTTVSLSDLSVALESDTDDIEILDVDVAEVHQY